MANEQNLVQNDKLTPSERRENAKKAGKASGKARRKKRLLKDCMLELLNMNVADIEQWNELSAMGFDIDKIDNRTLLTASLFMRAVDRGDVAAFKEIRNLIGEDSPNDESGVLDKLIGGLKQDG